MLKSLQDADSDVPAWLLGHGCMHQNHQRTAEGTPRADANPWLRRLYCDAQSAVEQHCISALPIHVLDFMQHDGFVKSSFQDVLTTTQDPAFMVLEQHRRQLAGLPLSDMSTFVC